MIAFLEANALYCMKSPITECSAKSYIFVGEKENGAMRKSAKSISEALPGSTHRVLPNMHHGEFSINNAGSYVSIVRKIIKNEQIPSFPEDRK